LAVTLRGSRHDIYLFGARTGESSRAVVPSRASAPNGYQTVGQS